MSKIVAATIILLTGFIASCSSLPRSSTIPITNTKHTIYFVYRKWHTSIVLDAKRLALASPKLAEDLRGEQFARIGWGDGDYFTGKSKNWSTATKALVASHHSALQLLTYGNDLSDIPAQTIVPLAISEQGLHQLIHHIDTSIGVDGQNTALRLPAHVADTGVFFQATGHYSFFNNCNTWSSQALRLAGLPIANRLTAQGVFEQAREISRIQAQTGLFDHLQKP